MPYSCTDISGLEDQLLIYESELSDLQDELAILQADLSSAKSLFDQYESNLANQKQLLFEKQVEKANAEANLRRIQNELAFLKLKLANLENEKADILSYIQTQPEIKSLWCADYTLDLSGQVGIADVPGEMNAMQLRPGYSGKAVYNSSRDGILQHAKAGSIANTWLQACFMPAVRKWKPQYRHGTITAINYDNDTCSISLAEATSQYLSTKFDINQTYELSAVPIEYMECNSKIFELGDKVLIEYPDRKTPKVVGFYHIPRQCNKGGMFAVFEWKFSIYNFYEYPGYEKYINEHHIMVVDLDTMRIVKRIKNFTMPYVFDASLGVDDFETFCLNYGYCFCNFSTQERTGKPYPDDVDILTEYTLHHQNIPEIDSVYSWMPKDNWSLLPKLPPYRREAEIGEINNLIHPEKNKSYSVRVCGYCEQIDLAGQIDIEKYHVTYFEPHFRINGIYAANFSEWMNNYIWQLFLDVPLPAIDDLVRVQGIWMGLWQDSYYGILYIPDLKEDEIEYMDFEL